MGIDQITVRLRGAKPGAMKSQELAHEPDALNIDKLPALTPDQLKQGVV